ncbi:MAG: amidohydrolase family protein [Chloroflexi bacterium]|nr:amidohydrolase family protein [Chloroflexota bacterium]
MTSGAQTADASAAARCIRAARVITCNGSPGAVLEDGVVVVRGSRIERVARAAEVADQLATLDVEHFPTGTLLPGMVDAHAHLTLAGDRRTYEQMILDPDEMMALVSVSNLQRHLACGVTTLRDNGGRNRVTFIVREAIRRGYFIGPRLLLSGRPVTHSYGHFYWCNGVADGADQIRAAVRQLVAEGADHIKIMASGGATAGNIPYYPSYTAAELRVAVEAAHALGRPTTAHCRARQSMVNAVEAGLDCIEHGEFLVPGEVVEYGGGVASSGTMEYEPGVTEQLLKTGTFVSYTMQAGGYDTLVQLRHKRTQAGLTLVEQAQCDSLEAYYEMKLGIFGHLLRDGMLPRLVISSDAGPFDCAFGRMHYGLELAVEGGMTPLQAIEATTRVAAAACRVDDRVGTLEAGKEADLLVVDGDPLQDITRMAHVSAVYTAGRNIGSLQHDTLLPGVVGDRGPL